MSIDTIREVLTAVEKGDRADQALARIAGPDCGLDGPSRRVAHESVMAIYRWKGWLGKEIANDLGHAIDLARGLDDRMREGTVLEGKAALEKASAWLAAQTGRSVARMDAWALFPTWLVDELPPAPEGSDPALHDLPLLAALQRRAPLWLRGHGPGAKQLPDALEPSAILVRPHPRMERAFEVVTGGDVYKSKAFHDGRFEVQDLASQTVVAACGARPGERWWDACAGAGGKTLALADRMGGKGSILATDPHEGRLTELKRRARRAGVQTARGVQWTGEGLPRSAKKAAFDGVLVDAPCSGSGTWRRNPEARWHTKAEDVARLAALQAKILGTAAKGVRPGGRLVYATCSLARSEDEAVVEAFLAAHPDFSKQYFTHPLTGETCDGTLRITPAVKGCDGDAMFVARLVKKRAPKAAAEMQESAAPETST